MLLITKLLGNRQMSQLSMFDYITGITLGSIGAEMATAGEAFLAPFIALVILGLVAWAIAELTKKALWLRVLFNGRPILLLSDSKLYEQNFRKARLDIHEFLSQCRTAGYFDISQLETAILESNGKISFLPKTAARPATVQDLQSAPSEECAVINLIVDGKLQEDNLRFAGYNLKWLNDKLHAANAGHISDVFLATCTHDGQVTFFKKSGNKKEKRLFS